MSSRSNLRAGLSGAAALLLSLACLGTLGVAQAEDAAVAPDDASPVDISIVGTTDADVEAAPDQPPGVTKRQMQIKIYNNTKNFNLYPVLSTGTAIQGRWLQSAFKIKKADYDKFPYPKDDQYRLFINPTKDGIPPGGSVVLKLPFLTQLVPTAQVNPKKSGQYIDWWGGGRLDLFEAPAKDHKPPAALTQAYTKREKQKLVKPIKDAVLPTFADCKPTKCQPLEIYVDPNGLENNEPSQLIEYTLGALNHDKNPITLNDHNVDYDVSYVDTAYLPAAMGPVGNKQVGYIGMLTSVEDFRDALQAFLAKDSPYVGWPQFVKSGKPILKIPSPLNLLPNPTSPLVTKGPWKPFTTMRKNWNDCIKGTVNDAFCKKARAVAQLFEENYKSYLVAYKIKENGCTNEGPEPRTADLIYEHVHGWAPFNKFCANPEANLLENTPGYSADNYKKYQEVKDMFDDLEYWPDGFKKGIFDGRFNPYVELIHSKDYIHAPYAYAFSVDDAMGNMQADGVGFVIAVGGSRGLENKDPATPPIHVSFGFAKTDKVRFTKYGICSDKPTVDVNPDFTSFDIAQGSIATCVISLLDNKGVLYKVGLKTKPPYPIVKRDPTPASRKPVDCSANKNAVAQAWCAGGWVRTIVETKTNQNYLILPAPQQP